MSFSQQLLQILEENHSNPDFNYATLCDLLSLSRSQVYRAFQKEDLGAPSNYIRLFRLSKGKILLTNSNLSISEIAYRVGYKTTAHFTASFTNSFGYIPSSIRVKEIEFIRKKTKD